MTEPWLAAWEFLLTAGKPVRSSHCEYHLSRLLKQKKEVGSGSTHEEQSPFACIHSTWAADGVQVCLLSVDMGLRELTTHPLSQGRRLEVVYSKS